MRRSSAILATAVVVAFGAVPAPAQQVNVLALGEGTLPVVEPESYGGWPAVNMLDDSSGSGWACPEGKIAGNVFVFEMAAPATIDAF